ncbi:magnesium transporter CorA family protein [Sporomusa acidovorans]|uniref:CorA-like Mg2+ transporter protein n=1 Tax=Sporomusa acidovorans (strain ATCC 49682 / DSM 3132 / Mol) TaxID=1123286 RepID=A0ABZ3J1I7_SPOA4|nr:magnesium transporter CorA family protein [Sporomusa acidovorans]OZC22817.1 CorA-like Mg2+ transporter protein [Sporomusa acidovorans DSM 3132]SDE51954.1 magnesium transporter [Sporomusa acidovorans]
MLTAYKSTDDRLQAVDVASALPEGTWLQVVKPAAEEIAYLSTTAKVPEKFFRFAFEVDSCPRIMVGDRCILIIINVPVARSADQYDTIPLSIILTPEHTITVSQEPTQIIPEGGDREFNTRRRSRFFFQILNHAGTIFLRHIYHIRQRTEEIEIYLRKSTNNREVFQLLNLEKGLMYFTAALRANTIVLESILRLRSNQQLRHLLPMHEEDEDIIENVIIENKRALELVQTYSDILSSMMDAFSSVISNNLNYVMRFLAAVTILLSIPTMISSFWSMSLVVPLQGTEIGFWTVILVSFLASSLAGIILKKKRML